METRFRALDFLCKLQVFIGCLVILGGVIFGLVSILVSNEPGAPPTPEFAGLLVVAIVVGLIIAGLQIIAMAQVYQCLMQIEINTRHEQPESPTPPQVGAEHPCPKCNSGPTEIYERSRDGERWICRACNLTWLVPA